MDLVKLGYLSKDIQQLEIFGNLILLRAKNDFRIVSYSYNGTYEISLELPSNLIGHVKYFTANRISPNKSDDD